jgi:hypothetical protein
MRFAGANLHDAALSLAARAGRDDDANMLELVLEAEGVDIAPAVTVAAKNAATSRDGAVLSHLLDTEDVDITAAITAAACTVASRCDLPMLDRLLGDHRADVPAAVAAALKGAAEAGSAVLTAWLLQRLPGRRIRVGAQTDMLDAGVRGGGRVLDELLADPRINPSAGDNTAIHNALPDGPADAVDRLLRDPRVGPPAAAWTHAGTWGWQPAVHRLLSEPRVLLRWPLPDAAQPVIGPALAGAAWARRRLAVMAWEAFGCD